MLKYLDCLYMLTSVFSDYEFVRIRGRNATETSWLIEILRRLLCIRFHSDRRCRGGRWVWRIVHIYLSLFVTNCGLVRSDSGIAATKPPFPGRYGRRFQFLAKAGERFAALFNLYTNYLPVISSRRFIYADDIWCALQAESFSKIECTLTTDLACLAKYCQLWRLKHSMSKAVTSVFHLHNKGACRELNVHMN